MTTKIKCKSCGTKIKKSDFCPFCGTKIENLAATDISIILDRSGSMSSVKESTIQAYNKFLEEQRICPNPTTISLYQFDDQYEAVYQNVSLQHALFLNDETYIPRATTALYDAIGRTITKKLSEKLPEQVLFCIITDGQENASREFNRKQIYNLITDCKKKGWQFAFLGAGIDAYAESAKIGIGRGQTMSVKHNAVEVAAGVSAFSANTMKYRSTGDKFLYKQTSKTEDE